MRVVIAVLVAGCSQPAKPAPSVAPRPPWQSTVTPLEIIVLDDYRSQETCDGVAPHQVDVLIDDKVVATVKVPCSTVVRAPPPQLAVPPISMPPGKHVIRVREAASGLEAQVELELPVFEPPHGEAEDDAVRALATKLPIWANEGELEIQGLRAVMTAL